MVNPKNSIKILSLLILFLSNNIYAGTISYEDANKITKNSLPIQDMITHVYDVYKSPIIMGIVRGGKLRDKAYKKLPKEERDAFILQLYTVVFLELDEKTMLFKFKRARINSKGVVLEEEPYKKDKTVSEVNEFWYGAKPIEKVVDIIFESFGSPIIKSLIFRYQKGKMPYYEYKLLEEDESKGGYIEVTGRIDAATGRMLSGR